jgi:hypothetical protein
MHRCIDCGVTILDHDAVHCDRCEIRNLRQKIHRQREQLATVAHRSAEAMRHACATECFEHEPLSIQEHRALVRASDKIRAIDIDRVLRELEPKAAARAVYIVVANGKYTFRKIDGDWRIHVLRYGEPWLVIEKDHNAIATLLFETERLTEKLKKLTTENERLHEEVNELKIAVTGIDGFREAIYDAAPEADAEHARLRKIENAAQRWYRENSSDCCRPPDPKYCVGCALIEALAPLDILAGQTTRVQDQE